MPSGDQSRGGDLSMRIALVVATDLDGTLGRDNRLPWHLPADLRHFKRVTMGKPMIMGRKTWESIGRALPGRTSIVLTHRADFSAPGAYVARTPDEAVALAASSAQGGGAGVDREVAVIGGAEVFHTFLPRAERIYWTEVQAHLPGDVHLEPFDPAVWQVAERIDHPADPENPYALRFLVLTRKGSGAP
jgi:dihydrofolate reductase